MGNEELIKGKMLIGGEWVDALDGRVINVENPARKKIIGTIPRGTAADVEAAVQAAERAFPAWKRTSPMERAALLRKAADMYSERIESIARMVSTETGNALRTQARGETMALPAAFHYYAGLCSELKGDTIPLGENVLSYTRREPYGVVGAIVPWNGPVGLSALKVAPALAAGNTFVLKPAEDASLSVLLMAEVLHEILPPGVFNVVTGLGEEAGAALSAHDRVPKVSFTGSTDVGRQIMIAGANRIAALSLELGGKSPCIVFPDSHEPATVAGVLGAMRFTRQSQSCTAGSRLFVHESIYDNFIADVATEVQKLKIGDPLDETNDVGSLISEKQFNRVCGYIRAGLDQMPDKLVVGGLPPAEGPLSEGYFTVPTIFSNTSNDWRLAREEIFGPVLIAIPWKEEDEVIRMANDTHFGLAAYVWHKNVSTSIRVAHAIECGWVQINQAGGQAFGQPYGGYKHSGLGEEFSLNAMLNSFTQTKAVTVNIAP